MLRGEVSELGAGVVPAKWLERALLFTMAAHLAAMALMGPCLLGGLPGGPNLEVGERAAWLAGHPWLWRLGWLGWQVTALSDVLLCGALLVTRGVPRGPALLGLLVTGAAFVPDQWAQWSWCWDGVALAQQAASDGAGRYRVYEERVFHMTAGLGAAGYTLGAVLWTWCFAALARNSGTPWTKGLWRLSWLTWCVFAGSTVVLFLPARVREAGGPGLSAAVGAGNAVAFVLLMVWLAWVGEGVFRIARSVVDAPLRGSWTRWRLGRGRLGRRIETLANSRLAREAARLLPSLAMRSDVQDVVYINWLVPAERLEPLVERPLRLQRVGERKDQAVFTVLTFRHGCFGPRCLGPLRRWWPSPVQSNWRVHVETPDRSLRGVQFVSTSITSVPHALATRLLADGVPMHVPGAAWVLRERGSLDVAVQPGGGSSPDLAASLCERGGPALTGRWAECFGSWEEILAFIVPQDRAMCVRWRGSERGIVRQEIELGIPLSACVALEGRVRSEALRAVVGDAEPLCFVVEKVDFAFERAGWWRVG
ncbi:MAG TPA: hypothetical protein VFF65_09085 [Phycisphaerales bacterium]|nr:hypothetical protein [Phycisphaerales bacterium]